ncbi:MAG TPA: DUF5908 family protein [Eudoraea sp.]|nr:DUF5908 family protein [Eudoraea sp.]
MTLIIKELVIRGIVSTDHSSGSESPGEKEALYRYLEQMKNEVKEECYEKLLQKLEPGTLR